MDYQAMKEVAEICRNCSSSFIGSFCSSCGQKKYDRSDFTLKGFVRDVAEEAFDYDSKIFSTLRLLIARPGKLTADFLNGKQKAYIAPVKLYLIIITLNFIVYSALDNHSPINVEYIMSMGSQDWFEKLVSQKQLESGMDKATFFHEMNLKVSNVFSFALYLLIFVYPLILKVYFYKSGKYYIEHLIFCLHFMSFGFLRDTLFLPLHMYNKDLGFYLSFITTVLYLFFALKYVYPTSPVKKWINPLILYSCFLVLFSLTILLSFTFTIIFY